MRSVSDSVYQMTLGQGNKDQNQHYPPGVFSTHFELATDCLLDQLVRLYPTEQSVIDILRPYLQTMLLPVKYGRVTIPEVEYRNFLGAAFFVNDIEKCDPVELTKFGFADKDNPTDDEIKQLNAVIQADSKPIENVSQGRWEYFTKHPYKKPKTFDKAKSCMFDDSSLKILPLGIPYVELRFIKKAVGYKYGYKMLPDDTFVFDQERTTEELWKENAIPYLFKAVNILYANYVSSPEYIASAKDLRENNLF